MYNTLPSPPPERPFTIDGALTICTEKLLLFFSDKVSNGMVQPSENFWNRRNAFEGIPLLFVSTKMTGISCTICKNLTSACHSLTHGRRLCEPGTSRPSLPSSIGLFMTNGTASYFDPFLPEEINCSICPKNPT